MILSGKSGWGSIIGMPEGRQFAPGYSLAWAPVIRSLVSASAQGWIGNSPGLKSVARPEPEPYLLLCWSPCQIPEMSGLPSSFRGAGAERSGLPSLVRGMPLVGTSSHCAAAGIDATANTAIKSEPVLSIHRGLQNWGYLPIMCFESFSFSLHTYS